MLERTTGAADLLAQVVDDYDEAPWLVMADAQGWAVNHFASTLETYVLQRGLPWTVATLLPVSYWSMSVGSRKVVSPDTFMARVPRRHRDSYDVEEEGMPPAFVLEVVSPDSVYRDTVEKLAIYEEMGVREYALFGPPVGGEAGEQPAGAARLARRLRSRRRRWPIDPPLQGWRRDEESGRLTRWDADATGRLWSEELGLWLAARDDEIGLQVPDGEWLLTHGEEAAARAREAEARRQAEIEAERLRQELEALRRRLQTDE